MHCGRTRGPNHFKFGWQVANNISDHSPRDEHIETNTKGDITIRNDAIENCTLGEDWQNGTLDAVTSDTPERMGVTS